MRFQVEESKGGSADRLVNPNPPRSGGRSPGEAENFPPAPVFPVASVSESVIMNTIQKNTFSGSP